jgi:YHS domain-containing protein
MDATSAPDMKKPAGDAAETPAAPAETPAAPAETPAADAPAADAPKVALLEDEIAKIKELPGGESEIALTQAVCLVSGEHLGAMGVPVKVEHDGKVGYLCCAGCKGDFEKDPAKFADKMAAAPK